MSPIDLDALRALHAAATPGEWITNGFAIKDGHDHELFEAVLRFEWQPQYGPRPNDAIAADCVAITDIHNAFLQLADELERLRAENDFMRLRLAESDKACVYCDLPASDAAKCASGFPGCARADDLYACDRMTVRDEHQRAIGAAKWLTGYIKGLLDMEPSAYTGAALAHLPQELERLKAAAAREGVE